MKNYFVWETPSLRFAVVDLKVPNVATNGAGASPLPQIFSKNIFCRSECDAIGHFRIIFRIICGRSSIDNLTSFLSPPGLVFVKKDLTCSFFSCSSCFLFFFAFLISRQIDSPATISSFDRYQTVQTYHIHMYILTYVWLYVLTTQKKPAIEMESDRKKQFRRERHKDFK